VSKRTKVCIGCLTALPLSRFNKYSQGKWGRRARCKTCQAIQRKTSAQRTAKRLSLEAKGKRKCSKCGKTKALSSFQLGKRKGRKPSREGRCKVCISVIGKKKHKNHNVEGRTFVFNYLKKHPCIECGESDVLMLEFDHRHSKKFDISNGVLKKVPMHILKAEIKKCDVRCSNHHSRKTHQEKNSWRYVMSKEGK
jgi:hypothetical protein